MLQKRAAEINALELEISNREHPTTREKAPDKLEARSTVLLDNTEEVQKMRDNVKAQIENSKTAYGHLFDEIEGLDRKSLKNRLSSLKTELAKHQEFSAERIKLLEKIEEVQGELDKNTIEGVTNALNGIYAIGQALEGFDPKVTALANSAGALADTFNSLKTFDFSKGLNFESLLSGDIAGTVSSVYSLAESFVDITTSTFNWEKAQEAINKQLEKTLEMFNDLNDNKGMSYFTDYSKTLEEGQKTIDSSNAKIAEYNQQIKQWEKKAKFDIGSLGFGVFGISTQVAEAKKAQKEIDKYQNAIKDLEKDIERVKAEMEQAETEFKNNLIGTTAEGIADSIVEGFKKGESAQEIFANNFQDIMLNSISKIFERQVWDQLMKQGGFVDMFTNAMNDKKLDPKEIENLKNSYTETIAAGQEMWNELTKAIPEINGSKENAEALKGSIKGITEKTAGVLEGQVNAMRINVAEILSVANRQLEVQSQIERNTRPINDIKLILEGMRTGNNSNDIIRANGL